jgi:hypothetical protein
MLVITEKPIGGHYFIAIENNIIVSDNPKLLVCLKKAYEATKSNLLVVKTRLGTDYKVIFLDLNKKEIKLLSISDWEAIKINYPVATEFTCEEVSQEEIKQIPRATGLSYLWEQHKKKILLYGALLIGSLYFAYTQIPSLFEEQKPQTVSHQPTIPKIVKKQAEVIVKEKKPVCLVNLPSFVNNFVLGAIVKSDNNTAYMIFKTSQGDKAVVELKPSAWNKPFNPYVIIENGIRSSQNEYGWQFAGIDYDICLDFIRKNTDKPLYIISLDEKGCFIVIPKSCLFIGVDNGSTSTGTGRKSST